MAKQRKPGPERHTADQPDQGRGDDDIRHAIFIVSARLLAYPDGAFGALLPEIEAYLRALPASDSAIALAGVAERLRATGVADLEARYVATFDFDESAALYLTAHELGDSRRRGQALVELRRLLRAAGFEETTEELPDYLPLLLEFLAQDRAAPALDSIHALERRLAAVCERVAGRLDADNPYRDVFVALRGVLPAPEEANPERRFSQREQADTGEMPYPLHYE